MSDINKHVARYLNLLEDDEKGPSPEEILARLGKASNPGMMGIFATHLRKTMMDIAQRKVDAKKAAEEKAQPKPDTKDSK